MPYDAEYALERIGWLVLDAVMLTENLTLGVGNASDAFIADNQNRLLADAITEYSYACGVCPFYGEVLDEPIYPEH